MSELAIFVISVAVPLFMTGIPGLPLVGYFWTSNMLADFCIMYLSLQHLYLALRHRPRESLISKLLSFAFLRAVCGLCVAIVLFAWVAYDPECLQENDTRICTSWLPVFDPGYFTSDCPLEMESCGIQEYRGGVYASLITTGLLVVFVLFTLSPAFLLRLRQHFRWRLWDATDKVESPCVRSVCRLLVFTIIFLSILGGLCNRVRGSWRMDYGFFGDESIFGLHGYVTGRACLAVGTGLLVFLLTGNFTVCLFLLLTSLLSSLPLGCSVYMARDVGAVCTDYGMFDWVLGVKDFAWPLISVGTCAMCGGEWDPCVVVEGDCNLFAMRAWRRVWSEMWLRGLIWFLPSGLVLYRAGFGFSLLLGGAVMFPALYELAWHLPTLTLAPPPDHWPFGPSGYQMLGHVHCFFHFFCGVLSALVDYFLLFVRLFFLCFFLSCYILCIGTSIDWAELLVGTYGWLLVVLSVLGAAKLEPEALKEDPEDPMSQPFIIWAADDVPPPPYSPGSPSLGNRNSVSSGSSARIVVQQLTPAQQAFHKLREALPLTVSEGRCCARLARGLLVGLNWLHVFLTMVTIPLLGFVIAENNFV